MNVKFANKAMVFPSKTVCTKYRRRGGPYNESGNKVYYNKFTVIRWTRLNCNDLGSGGTEYVRRHQLLSTAENIAWIHYRVHTHQSLLNRN